MNRFVLLPAFKLLSLSDSDSERGGEWSWGDSEEEREEEDKVGEAIIGCCFPSVG